MRPHGSRDFCPQQEFHLSDAALDVISKRCTQCSKTKPASEFHKDSRLKSGLRSYCIECGNQYKTPGAKAYNKNLTSSEEYKAKRRSRHDPRKNRDQHLRAKYGITIEDFEEMLEEQGFACEICPNELKLFDRETHVDHCHTTGKVRGLLCNSCNNGLGRFRDNLEYLQNAMNYLKKYQ